MRAIVEFGECFVGSLIAFGYDSIVVSWRCIMDLIWQCHSTSGLECLLLLVWRTAENFRDERIWNEEFKLTKHYCSVSHRGKNIIKYIRRSNDVDLMCTVYRRVTK